MDEIKSIGIIGGGQLGLMMMDAAHGLGLKANILDPDDTCPASKEADVFIKSKFDDEANIEKLCKISDTVSFEFENIPYEIVEKFSQKYNIPQGAKPLYISQHRMREKNSAKEAGMNVGGFLPVSSEAELISAVEKLGYPCVLKTCQFGYDGKGQVVLKSDNDLDVALPLAESCECILESFINFECEASVILIKDKNGEFVFMPIAKNIHRNNILFKSIVPSGLSEKIEEDMRAQAKKLVDYLGIDGILAIEFFVCTDGVYFNEMAPRPHNSGHYSIEGCKSSQFEQIVRCVCGLPFGDSKLIQPTVMVNVLGQDMDNAKSFNKKGATVHLYGKKEAKHNRKMGHITFVGDDIDRVINDSNEFLK